MRFADIPGNEDVKRALAGMVDSGRVPHAIMFYENEGCGALAIAIAFLQYLNCRDRGGADSCAECPSCNKVGKLIHPDIHYVFPVASGGKVSGDKPTSESYSKYWRELVLSNPYFLDSELNEALGIEGKSSIIAVAEARSIVEMLSLTALEGGYKCVVVYLPEKMNVETANRLLKSIEEPPELTQFVFITHAPEKVLTTISSRCQGIRILPLTREEVSRELQERFGKSADKAEEAAAMAGGSVGRALAYIESGEDADENMSIFTSLMEALVAKDLTAALDAAEAAASLSSREKAKAFCRFAADGMRKIFMLQQRLPQLAGVPARDESFYARMAAGTKKSFPRMAMAELDRTSMLIERNVNVKILFCDLTNRLFTYI